MTECKAWQGGCKDAYAAGYTDATRTFENYQRLVENLSGEIEKLTWMLDEYVHNGDGYRRCRQGYRDFYELVKQDLAEAWQETQPCATCAGRGCADCINEDAGSDR